MVTVPTTSNAIINPNEAWEDKGGAFSSLTLGFLTPLLRRGASATISQGDVGTVPLPDRASACHDDWERVWADEVSNGKGGPDVMRAQIRVVGARNLATAIGFYITAAALQFVPVFILNILVQHFSGTGWENLSFATLALMTVALLVLPVVGSLCQTRHDVMMLHFGLRARTAVSVAIYRHALKLTSAARQGVSTGEVVNLFSNDALKVEMFMKFMAFMIVAPVQVGVALFLIYGQVGDAMFVGLGFMIFLIPIQGFVFGALFKYQKLFVKLTDKRVGIMNEVLSGIRVVKYYVWEAAFARLVAGMREKEIIVLTKLAYVVAIGFSLVLLSAPIIQPVLIFYTYVDAEGKSLDAATAFTTIALFNLLRFPFAFMPMGFVQYLNCKVASKRLTRFLTRKTITEYVGESGGSGKALAITAGGETKAATFASEAQGVLEADQEVMLCMKGASLGWGVSEPLMDPFVRKSKKKSKQAKGAAAAAAAAAPPPIEEEKEEATAAATTTLSGVDLEVRKGSLVAVVGPVGGGKSSLLAALTGEMQLLEGSVGRRKGCEVALASQAPWILNRTLRENVVFAKPWDAKRYELVVEACCLAQDLAQLPGGDQCEIGEKGINLSGGQKARVALARAVYADADVYLLDDPLSAVDAHVGKALFEKCLAPPPLSSGKDGGGSDSGDSSDLLRGKTRVLVTHHVHYLKRCDKVVVMEGGKVTASGTFDELLAAGVPVVVNAVRDQEAKEEEERERQGGEEAQAAAGAAAAADTSVVKSGGGGGALVAVPAGGAGKPSDAAAAATTTKKRAGSLIEQEERAVGDVSLQAYVYYAQAGGWKWVVLALGTMLAGRACEVFSTFWLSLWSAESLRARNDGNKDGSQDGGDGDLAQSRTSFYLLIYALAALGGVLGLTLRSLCIATHRLMASTKLHNNLVASVLRAPLSFFDVTPLGRILNRFSADVQTVDVEISQSVSQLAGTVTNVLGALAAISAATKGTFLVLLAPLLFVYLKAQRLFRCTSTEVERLAKISRSPIFADFSQTLTGASSIRAYACQEQFVVSATSAMDANNACVLVVQLCFSWLSIRLDVIGALVMFFIVSLAVLAKGFMPAGWLGLALSFAIELTTFLKHAVRMFAAVEGQMASVERIMSFTQDISMEEPEFLGLDQEAQAQAIRDAAAAAAGAVGAGAMVVAKKQSAAAAAAAAPMPVVAVAAGLRKGGGADNTAAAAAAARKSLVVPPPGWPSRGSMTFEGATMGYREGPDVLKDLTFTVQGGEKVGVVGRTGSGKSSLMACLFRICELRSGTVLLDGVDTRRVRLQELRRCLCIIPQDPVMFSSTVRFNLDPFSLHVDFELWAVLRKVHLSEVVEGLPNKMDEMVAEGGENFSMGQRQLMCIARALLRQPRVLVLDEATASIDNETDALIQTMIRTEFKSATVLTVAHRLHTIMDSDRVLVLDDGRVAEFDTPQALLEADNRGKGLFKGMVEAANAAGSMH